jgi:'Cold-shock' DNA-binding domain
VFVHISAVEKASFTSLAEGAKVTFDVVPNRGKESAENLRIASRLFLTIMVVALCATQAVVARTHHRAPKSTAPVATKAGATFSPEKNRHPRTSLSIAGIKAICREC